MITAVLSLTLGKQEKDLSLILAITASVMAVSAAFRLMEPVFEFLRKLEQLGDLQSGVLGILLKITGVGITAEVSSLILTDSGNTSLAKGVHLISSALIVSLSLPILETLLELIQSVLGGL